MSKALGTALLLVSVVCWFLYQENGALKETNGALQGANEQNQATIAKLETQAEERAAAQARFEAGASQRDQESESRINNILTTTKTLGRDAQLQPWATGERIMSARTERMRRLSGLPDQDPNASPVYPAETDTPSAD